MTDYSPYEIRHEVNEYTGRERWAVYGPRIVQGHLTVSRHRLVRSRRTAERVARRWLHRWWIDNGWHPTGGGK